MNSKNDYKKLRKSFEQVANLYQQARPDYPEELFDDFIHAANLNPGDRLLEVGCASGKATLPLAKRGFMITCVELGAELAAVARQNLVGMDVDIITGSFEDWQPEAEKGFDLVFAATAWKWVDPEVRYIKAWQALRPGGHLAFWNADHVFPIGGDPFFHEIQTVYYEIGEGKSVDTNDWTRPNELHEQRDEIEKSGLFGWFTYDTSIGSAFIMLMSILNSSKPSLDTYLWRNGNATSYTTRSEFVLIDVQISRFAAIGVLFSMLPVEKTDNGENDSSLD